MLAALMEVPRTEQQWAIWSRAHRDQHELIRLALQNAGAGNLPLYPLDPIPFFDLPTWLTTNQQAHNDFNSILGLRGSDLQDLDPTNENQLAAWIFLHRREHEDAAAALKIG